MQGKTDRKTDRQTKRQKDKIKNSISLLRKLSQNDRQTDRLLNRGAPPLKILVTSGSQITTHIQAANRPIVGHLQLYVVTSDDFYFELNIASLDTVGMTGK